MMKKSLIHLHSGGELNYAEFESVLARAADIINDRPLGVRVHGKAEGDLLPVTPNLLLRAKTATYDQDINLSADEPSRLVKNQKRMEEVVGAWWNEWYSQVFSSLIPYKKWKDEKPNLSVGDVCLVKYDHKVGKADYRICKVQEVEIDNKGLVRTVTVGMRPRDSREKSLPYKSKKLKALRLAVQRLILICPAVEAKKLLDDAKHEVPGNTVAFIGGKTTMVGEPRGMRSAMLDELKKDEDIESSDEDADDETDRPAVPRNQPACVPAHYAHPAKWVRFSGTSSSSDWIDRYSSVLTPLNMQECAPGPVQVMDKKQNERDMLSTPQDYEMLMEVEKVSVNTENDAQSIEQAMLSVTQCLDVLKEVEEVPVNAENAAKPNKEPLD